MAERNEKNTTPKTTTKKTAAAPKDAASDYEKAMDRILTVVERMDTVISSMQGTLNTMSVIISRLDEKTGVNGPTATLKIDDLVNRIANTTAEAVYNMLDQSGVLDCCNCCDEDDDDSDEYDPYDCCGCFSNDPDDCDGCCCGDEDDCCEQHLDMATGLSAPDPERHSNYGSGTIFHNCTFDGDVYIQQDDCSKTKTKNNPNGFARLRYPIESEEGYPRPHRISRDKADECINALHNLILRNKIFIGNEDGNEAPIDPDEQEGMND